MKNFQILKIINGSFPIIGRPKNGVRAFKILGYKSIPVIVVTFDKY